MSSALRTSSRFALAFAPLAVLAAASASGCATTDDTRVRELPVGLSSLGALLDGCQAEAGDDGVSRLRCANDVVLATRTRPAGLGEPAYRAEGYGMAQLVGARLVWDQTIVPTEGPSGLVDRARALEPGTDAHRGTLIGAVRSVGPRDVEEIWCTAPAPAGVERCQELVGTILSTHTSSSEPQGDEPGASSPPAAAQPAAPSVAARAAAVAQGPVTVFGRALSLPTACTARASEEGGDASCRDGTSVSWRRFAEMAEATTAVEATLEALQASDEGTSYDCAIVGEPGQCAEHPHAVAGITYVDGRPVAVLCVGVKAARDHSLCRALLVPR